ncbi:Regulatory protein, LysR-family [Azotobacter vinelandii CA]|uniref:Regulatory protein, LysR-family n=2 Tax=Azotobacter vinelandii TaxID=354 RepID=C1DR72_AZOVD|nr:LysR family transcriptional regulator [Azotobacter vinelandii]ACO79730.1 Regulatory protein, LysR-family [Azotobacter vinelandii DJ]AGK14589.1 Regulatory protein, LysR-family [Azotobacter vinelandii CA]AGK21449.1 Regulatory protein, LysR-family [Azotobacter vinelandii CA6]SFY23423.1 transcriptional regulator, LysR family [Azotobacter vinelandii]GLK59210.1 LysR family transcriptional regulator [Azotobacter vinelandii]
MSNSLRRLDLNLLVTLDALLVEHNVTRAAERLHLAQPTVSVQLARLRDFFGDPLLLPGPRGMRPTARADELREPLRQALAALDQAVAPSDVFDPAQANHTWRVAAFDYGEFTILLPALAAIRAAAPATRLAVVQTAPAHVARKAEQGDIDLAFMIGAEAPQDLRRRTLFTERYMLAGRAGHPRLKRRPTLAQFCRLDHAIVSPDGGGFHGVTDTALAERGLARRVALSVPHFLFLSAVLASTDLVAMVPSRLVSGNAALQVVEPPLEVPGFEMLMLWSERVHRDAAHQWLREHIARSV